MNQGLAMLGGGTGAEAVYAGDGMRFIVTLMADNPMVGAMGAMLGNPMLMATAGEIVRVGRQKFVDQDGELTGLVDNRILVQASGAETRRWCRCWRRSTTRRWRVSGARVSNLPTGRRAPAIAPGARGRAPYGQLKFTLGRWRPA
jgi:hypothetical protein